MARDIVFLAGMIIGAAIVVWLVLTSRVYIELLYSRVDEDDLLRLKLRALYGLIRYKVEIPVFDWSGMHKGIAFMKESVNLNMSNVTGEGQGVITQHTVLRQFERWNELLRHTLGLHRWLLHTLRQVHCEGLEWVTEVGVGDAPDTAITAGLVWGIQSSMLGFIFRYVRLRQMPVVNVVPLFNEVKLNTHISGKFYIRLNTALAAGFRLSKRIARSRSGFRAWLHVFQRV